MMSPSCPPHPTPTISLSGLTLFYDLPLFLLVGLLISLEFGVFKITSFLLFIKFRSVQDVTPNYSAIGHRYGICGIIMYVTEYVCSYSTTV